MADSSQPTERPRRAPMPMRTRKRWAVAGAIAGLWVLLLSGTHSIVGGTALLALLAALAIGSRVTLRLLGIDHDHPWVQRAATRPWRDGCDVLRLALRHLPDVFVITPSGSLLAPNLVELRMNPADVASLTDVMELAVVNGSASELYESKVTAHAARLASVGPVEVSILADPEVPVGRYRLKQGRRGDFAYRDGDVAGTFMTPSHGDVAGTFMTPSHDGRAHDDQQMTPTLVRDVLTVEAPSPVPLLRLVMNDSVAETRVSGARAGRGSGVELSLPDEPTVSRVHAEFAFAAGQWRISNLGRNGVLVNGMPVDREHPVRDGDLISWGPHPGALVSRVEVGSGL
jgi:FHA domain